MKNIYFTLVFLSFGFFVSGQTSSEVGITEGQLSVSLSGGANYAIPIAVPPGINGVVPKIGLAYNSQSDNGSAGYGWNISGLSSIKRIPSTKYHDGISDAVDFDNLDRFSLDGQRLILKNGVASSYGTNEAIYETENFSNIKVTSFGVHSSGANYGPAYFKVEYPDGSKAIYGNSKDSCSITEWAITYWENAQGVRINYTYALSNNILNIISIKYGGRLDNTPINEIQFVYKARLREEQTYTGGQLFIRNTILSNIKVLSKGDGFRNYSLVYDVTSLFYERLIKITEKSGDNSKSYNPTIFEYENTADTISMLESFTALSVNPTPVMPVGHVIDNNTEYGGGDMKILGDFGMDNKFGLITFSSNAQKRSNYIFYPNVDSNTTSAIGTKIYTKEIFDEIFLVNTLSGNDSSGYKLKQNQNWCVATTDHESNLATFSVFSNNPDGNSPVKLEHEINYTFPMYVTDLGRPDIEKAVGAIKTYLSGDFNGDNITDAIIIECGFSNVNNYIPRYLPSRVPQEGDIRIKGSNDTSGGGVYFVNLDPRITSNAISFAGRLSGEFRQNVTGGQGQSSFFAADVNGDGKTDIVVTTKNVIDIYSLNEDNVFVKVQTLTIPVSNTGYSQYLWPGIADYNGDGKIDYGPRLFGDGISFVPSDNTVATSYVPGSMGKFIDFNNDGTTDAFSRSSDGYNLKFSSTINLFPLAYKSIVYDYSFSHKYNYKYTVLNNKNTMSKNQVILFEDGNANGNALRYLTLNKDLSKDKLLKSVTLGNGVKQIITYSSLINGNGVYSANSLTENYPNQDIINAPELKVVSKIEKQSKSQYKKQLFFYSGAVTNLEGLGFLGFYSTVRTNWHDDNSPIISYVSKNDLSLRGANVENYEILGLYEPLQRSTNQIPTTITKEDNYTVTGTENLVAAQSIILKPDTWIKPGSNFSAKINGEATNTSVNEPTSFITKSLLTYESNLLANKVFKIKNSSNKQFNGLENTSNETTTDYDEYNNPIKITVIVKEDATLVQTSISDMMYESNATPYIIGKPIGKIQNVTLGTDKMTTEELYSYNSNQLLAQIKKRGDATTNFVTEDNVYDVFGNIIKKTINAGLDTRETSFEYDASGRFVIKNSDVEKLVTTYDYNDDGTLKSKTNPFGQITRYNYDVWFKKIKESYYFNGITNSITTYSYVNNAGNTDITKTSPGGSVFNELFDDLGRKIRTGSKNIMDSFTYTSYQYDIQDRNYKVSEPYIGTTPSLWNETKYDDYGHINEIASPTGKITNIAVTGLTTTINDGVKTKTYIKNALGNVVTMYDLPNNIIKYTYFANGNLKESDYGGIKTTITQDGWGRKIQIEDPSAGIFKYKYNDFGDLIREESKNGITSYKLDSTGKIDEKTISGRNTNSKTTYVIMRINWFQILNLKILQTEQILLQQYILMINRSI
jgi:YD repeat-containing protein